MELSRRDALKIGLFGGAAALLPLERAVHAATITPPRLATSLLPAPFSMPFTQPAVLTPSMTDATTDYYKLVMKPFGATVIPGFVTRFWGYNAQFPGPTIRVNQGRKTVVRQTNSLPSVHPTLRYNPWTSVHLHGSASDPDYDGYASDVTNPGQYKDYRYPNFQAARTLWYHDHGVSHTAENVHMGLAGQYHLLDPLEQSLPIPHGAYDVPLIITDYMFTRTGQILFDNHDGSGMYGDVILVNDKPWPAMKVARRKYRFRVLNASISRSYNYSLSTGDPFTVIGTDAGLMPAPVQVRSVKHGMAERYEIVIDFAKYSPGTRVVLKNTSPKNNIDYAGIENIMAFDVTADAFDTANNSLPDQLNPANPAMTLPESESVQTRQFNMVRENGQWTINGHTWEDVVQSGFTRVEANPKLGDTEVWEVRNLSGGWFHPVHIHLVDFKVLDRNGAPPFAYERGPKDVVYLGENETVRLLMRFENAGKYMIHCHNLVHEDHDMMTQFEVTSDTPAIGPFDAPPYWLPAPSGF